MVISYPFEPRRNFVFAISANVSLNDNDGKERRQCYENHVHTEIGTCRLEQTNESRSIMAADALSNDLFHEKKHSVNLLTVLGCIRHAVRC